MLAFLLAPFYFIVNRYLFCRIIKWLKTMHQMFQKKRFQIVVAAVHLFLVFSMVPAFFLPSGKVKRFMKLINNYWMGILMYLTVSVVTADLLRLIYCNVKSPEQRKLCTNRVLSWVGGICTYFVLSSGIQSIYNAKHIRTTHYDVTISKNVCRQKDWTIVLIADLHLGYNIGHRHMKQMIEKINRQHPDLVVIAGDIFDNEYDALEHPKELASLFRKIESRCGVYAVYGNHDVEEKVLAGFTFGGKKHKASHPKMDLFLKQAGIHLLRDEYVLIDDSFYLYGRADYERPGRGIQERKKPNEIVQSLDLSNPVIVLDHEPRELEELSKSGVDMDLCGHTHNGQIFPGNIITGFVWENSYGYLKKGTMHNIVTSGAGLCGPNMRLGTIPEICAIHVSFKNCNF